MTENIKTTSFYTILGIVSAILIIGTIVAIPTVNLATAQSPPQITITEAYANPGTEYFDHTPPIRPIFHPQVRIFEGDTVYRVQPLQFREDFSYGSRIIHVYCAIDGQYRYRNYCSTPFEGKAYSWILNAGIPINNLSFGPHTFSVLIDTENGRTNTATFHFRITYNVPFD